MNSPHPEGTDNPNLFHETYAKNIQRRKILEYLKARRNKQDVKVAPLAKALPSESTQRAYLEESAVAKVLDEIIAVIEDETEVEAIAALRGEEGK